jgi:hypothetical protein
MRADSCAGGPCASATLPRHPGGSLRSSLGCCESTKLDSGLRRNDDVKRDKPPHPTLTSFASLPALLPPFLVTPAEVKHQWRLLHPGVLALYSTQGRE